MAAPAVITRGKTSAQHVGARPIGESMVRWKGFCVCSLLATLVMMCSVDQGEGLELSAPQEMWKRVLKSVSAVFFL